jgi:hypothetical protein
MILTWAPWVYGVLGSCCLSLNLNRCFLGVFCYSREIVEVCQSDFVGRWRLFTIVRV